MVLRLDSFLVAVGVVARRAEDAIQVSMTVRALSWLGLS